MHRTSASLFHHCTISVLVRLFAQSRKSVSLYCVVASDLKFHKRKPHPPPFKHFLKASGNIRPITLFLLTESAEKVMRKAGSLDQISFGIADATGQLAFLHTSLIAAAMSKTIKSLLYVCLFAMIFGVLSK